MKKLLPILLLCALMLLAACGKKQAEPIGSGSAEETAQTQTEKNTKNSGKTAKNTKETAMPESSANPKASAAPSGGKSSGGKSSPAATPTPKVENWTDVQEVQQEVQHLVAVNPVGNWIDKSTGAAMVIDQGFHGSILLAQADGSNAVWTFTGTYDLERAELAYSDGMKLVQNSAGLQTVYEHGSGTLAPEGDKLVWIDETGNQTMTFERDN